jgi:hypothetical protein
VTEPENFLTRWSRRKAEAEHKAAEAPGTPGAVDAQPNAADTAKPDVVQASALRETTSSPAATKPEFDLTSLPSLDSITAMTDIRGFLAPGVPQALSRAALRRAWLADPAIRDFVGLQENDWDFTNPAAVPGFGDMPPGYDIKKMIAQIFGEADPAAEQAPIAQTGQQSGNEPQATAAAPESQPAETAAATASDSETAGDARPVRLSAPPEISPEPSHTDFVRRETDIAAQQNAPQPPPAEPKRRRQHGGALPQS